jgi:nicotinamide-nucleotide amidase
MSEAPVASVAAHDDATLHHLAEQLGDLLRANRHTVCTAESCTGGWIAKMITDIPGCSDWFECGVAAYSYEAKQALLGVRQETLTAHGAVSRETVLEMVSGAMIASGASLAVAVTGIAGPPAAPRRSRWARCGSAGSGAAAIR